MKSHLALALSMAAGLFADARMAEAATAPSFRNGTRSRRSRYGAKNGMADARKRRNRARNRMALASRRRNRA